MKLEVEDFSGGVTDYYLNAPANKAKVCDNLLIIQYPEIGKPFTRPGCQLYSSAAPQIPAGAQRISTAFNYKDLLHVQSSQKLYYFGASAWNDILGPTGNNAFTSATTATYFTYAHWNYHTLLAHTARQYPQKVVINSSNVPTIFEAGLPRFDASTTTFTPTAGANSWLYKLVYSQTYVTKDNITFADYGSPSAAVTVGTAATTVAITTIPVLTNGATANFRTASIKVEIYRTVNNGTVFYKVGEVTNGTTTFNDNVSDATLVNNLLLYTEGGVVENDRPPKCKLVHVVKDTAYYANIEDSAGQVLNYRVLQSVPGDIDAVPEDFYVECDDEIVGLSSTKSNLILLCRNSIYRVDGFFDNLGRGGMTVDRISDTAGCVSGQSPVQALDGVLWLGTDGVYFTDGFQVKKLNQDYDKTYKTFVSNGDTIDTARCERIQGKYDKKKNRVWWTIQSSGTDVNQTYVLDLNWGVRENATFTTCSGGDSFAPTAIEFVNGELIRCDSRGYVLIHKDSLRSDVKIDVLVAPTSWVKKTIVYQFESIAYNFGTSFTRKWVSGINVTCESTTNLSLQITSNNDDDRVVSDLLPIRYRGNVVWGEDDIYWGDPDVIWNQAGLIHEKRRMPAGSLRCNYKRIYMTNAQVAIINSNVIGTADINSVSKTLTLTNTAAYDWPSNAVDYYVAFAVDDYVREYLITARTNDVLTFEDLNNASVNTIGTAWVIRGLPKDEVLNLLNYSVNYEMFGPTQHAFQNSESGEVGA